jgi:excisionase family DNA binding protein
MNAAVEEIYAGYLRLTEGDKVAAASLTLADTMLGKQSEPPCADAPLNVKEAASLLRVSTRRIYELCAAGQLRAFKVGRALRITPEMLEEFQRQGSATLCRQESFGRRPNRCL